MENEEFFTSLTSSMATEAPGYTPTIPDPEADINIIATRRYVNDDSDTQKLIQFTYSSRAKYAHDQVNIDPIRDTSIPFPETIDETVSIVYIIPVSQFVPGTETYPIYNNDTLIGNAYNYPGTPKYLLCLSTAKPGSLYIRDENQIEHRQIMYKAMDKISQLIQTNTPFAQSEAIAQATEEEQEAMGLRYTFAPAGDRTQELRAQIESKMNSMRQRQDQAMALAGELTELSSRLTVMEAAPDLIDLREIKHPLVDSIISKKRGSPEHWYIEVKTKSLFMRPDRNPDNFRIPEEGIVIDPMFILIDPTVRGSSRITFKPVNRNSLKNGYSRSRTVHPHVFGSPLTACFGSFGDAVTTAIAEGNYDVLVDVLMIFLQQANDGDPAGRTWLNWLTQEQRQPVGETDSEETPEEQVGRVIDINCRTCANQTPEGACTETRSCTDFRYWVNSNRPPIPVEPGAVTEVTCDSCEHYENDYDEDEDPCSHCREYDEYEAA